MVSNGRYEAYADPERTLKTAHLLKSAHEIIPLSRSRARDIPALRKWAEANCRLAAAVESEEPEYQTDSAAGRRARLVDLWRPGLRGRLGIQASHTPPVLRLHHPRSSRGLR